MPITRSAIKSMRSDARKHKLNQMITSEIKTLLKKVTVLASQDLEKAKAAAQSVTSKLDKAARKGIIPKGRADRKKADLGRLLSKAKS
ncbi:MAG: 30S ribosomal protein S20 [Candidatus Omnitrophica bacterium CG11_big_fil_rev_8_21_14_0_20_45_26]|uniref:Small ribosomal subunit protein bS20 n=1 Tax=Candidatus Abzuiibacterium crystallinum TaxID=1974748 RepID=A0A2H0LL55_9BACT|nr:MAG: 30S ribosomal protein S20 [Candidatus Omnitrophica bacterium CG11_big_fil_rev_8_21_14_0_20_45_26]PIW63796.1 MAG: 30S ribosomal protein S20 [Candidatus Omnitrophica bacterium CG12_big_fil_rev_8_21_14_0_65_45_16]